jgi:HSP20 family protein
MLTRWEPFGGLRRRGDIFSELNRMQQEMNRYFDDFFGERQNEMMEGNWLPVVDVSETDTELKVRAELPGLTQDDIDLNLQDNVLTLKGEKKQEKKEEKENYCRSFTLSAGVKQEDIKATFKDGILEIILPKVEEAKPKKIAITPGS